MSIINSSNDYDMGGNFMFGNEIITTCNISSNGFIYFDKINTNISHNPFLDPNKKVVAPFSGNMAIGPDGIITDTVDDMFVVNFNCYSNKNNKNNVLNFCAIFYLSSHPERPNEIDFIYTSSISRTDNFLNNYYIGYCDGSTQKYISDVDKLDVISYGGSNIVSSNIFPNDGSTLSNITNIIPAFILPNSTNSIVYNIDLGGKFIYNNENFEVINVSSNGYVFFGNGPTAITTNPFSNLTWKIIAPFAGNLATTPDGVKFKLLNNVLDIIFYCYSKQNSSANILIFGVRMYLTNHPTRSNQVDFMYVDSVSRSFNFFGNYYIGCSNGSKQKSIIDAESMIIAYGSTCIQTNTTSNVFPLNDSNIIDVTNIIPNNTVYLASRFSALEKNVDLGGTIIISGKQFTTCTISTNGFVYFGCKENINYETNKKSIRSTEPAREPNPDTSNPFKIKEWIIYAPFCGKLKTSPSGIIVTKNINDYYCIVTFNCHTTQTTNSAIASFSVKFCYYDHLETPNSVTFMYGSEIVTNSKQNYWIGYSDGINQKCLENNTDKILVDGTSNVTSTKAFPTNKTINVVLY